MRKYLHDSLLRATMQLIHHPTRSEANADSFNEARKTCKKIELLECERIFFNNKLEKTFAEANADFFMNLLDKERALLVLEKRVCWSRSAFDNAHDWTDFQNELKHYHVKHCVQTKAHERDKQIIVDKHEQSEEHGENDKDDDSDTEIDDDDRFSFTRKVHDEVPMRTKTFQNSRRKMKML